MEDTTHRFNTGRLYSEKGQRIAWKRFPAGVYFSDVDRGVYGFIPHAFRSHHDISDDWVLEQYDRFNYRYAAPEELGIKSLGELWDFQTELANYAEEM